LQADQFPRERSKPSGVTAGPPHVAAIGPAQARNRLCERRDLSLDTGSFSSNPTSMPMRRMRSPCCARAASGHAAAPRSPAMKSRRRMPVDQVGGRGSTGDRQPGADRGSA
jgi:hypothetical protein